MRQIIPEFILASKSTGRNKLLKQLLIEFSTIPANIDETAETNEPPEKLAKRLSIAKGQAVLDRLLPKTDQFSNNHKNPSQPSNTTNLIIISSDQVAVFNNKIYGKPGSFANAYKQLKLFNNNIVEFITGLHVINYDLVAQETVSSVYKSVTGKTKLKNLSDAQIKGYLEKETPFSCAASLKVEGLGAALLEYIETDDFNAIIGLPLLELTKIFEKMGIDILTR